MRARSHSVALGNRSGKFAQTTSAEPIELCTWSTSGMPSMYCILFQKKSGSGIATVQRDVNLIRQRLKLAHKVSEERGDQVCRNENTW